MEPIKEVLLKELGESEKNTVLSCDVCIIIIILFVQ